MGGQKILNGIMASSMYSFSYYIDSWIEVASQPSSSSLSSGAPNDEIVTTGLRVQRQHQQRRRRRGSRHPFAPENIDLGYQPQQHPSSSQDEYEETESESDRGALTSSNEDVARPPAQHQHIPLFPETGTGPGTSSASDIALSSDEDDNSTALGIGSNTTATTFTPQPNAFSHPPASQASARSRTSATGYASSRYDSNRPGTRRNSRSGMHSTARRARNHQQHQHSPYNMISPSHQADNDAALRASLSTLLSCAAAARGLPKRDGQPCPPTATGAPTERTGAGASAEPSTFRLVPESVAMGDESGTDHNNRASDSPRLARPPVAAATNTPPRTRRKASPSKDRDRDRTAAQPSAKRSRRTATTVADTAMGPTVMTWVISAGVVVLFSAISFSAGYMLGREVGRMEAAAGGGQGFYGMGSGSDGMAGTRGGAACGQEAVRGGLRRFRWISGGTGSGVSA